MRKLIKWVSDLFDSESTVSSKRFVMILLLLWGISFGGFYVVKMQFKGIESASTVDLIKFALGAAVTIGIGGTATEALKNRYKNPKE